MAIQGREDHHREASTLTMWWRKLLPAKEGAECTCHKLPYHAEAKRRAKAAKKCHKKIKSMFIWSPMQLPRKYAGDARDRAIVGGRPVPFIPSQNDKWKTHRNSSSFEAIDEDILCTFCAQTRDESDVDEW
ncbi:hypothetical protein SPRG_12140 [Saprolegnia parasitica CBS 223.65]|uniref:Uncharacterized protein n=1 Tax=Saprolegnia parasitica (strain CBS 223.65) TaxID=695850 RepID=A0A067BZM3_SAPPC|nr:hypothetical protein SPRG_12140 [Saprolegnia parasitica CBS 223.65]KDO22300.1 hypothetical protein SPRG_12140 [Saprolegnia parasitica CBS 223.65]|eukprot:XP_012207033.1 hypothetical protein SPRG_12140 [Saprolegnia parasitica CBS 223.65]